MRRPLPPLALPLRAPLLALSLLALPLLALSLGCGPEDPGSYLVSVTPTPDVPGTRLFLEGTPEGGAPIALALTLDAEGEATFELPGGVRLASLSASLERETSCGVERIAMNLSYAEFREENAREEGETFQLSSHPTESGVPPYHQLLIDQRGFSAPIDVGAVSLPLGTQGRVMVPRLADCETPITVRSGAEELGTLPDSGHAVLLSSSASFCYRHRVAQYGDGASGPWFDRILTGQQMYQLEADSSFFLEPAPQEVWSSRLSERRGELLRIPCP